MGQRFRFLLLLSTALLALHLLGLDVTSLPRWLSGKLSHAGTDTQALLTGEYTERTAARLKAEAELKRLQDVVPTASGGDEYQQELAAERKRIMEAKAQAASQSMDHIAKGDIEGLKQQVAQQAAQAAEAARQQ
jgi:hypothetical protein